MNVDQSPRNLILAALEKDSENFIVCGNPEKFIARSMMPEIVIEFCRIQNLQKEASCEPREST